ncbi:methyltransferase-like protein 25 isoform X2 [Pseudomyrmex gracilis]|uniref:methyltransferase-like protein 25 isoform X2 n=1 Tax=Pseudomyrmex gracilis TaxID=219809 RepID=UPI000994DD93|nr:methyltransferase-like protein 25 isoform X2 [Pseudomyrmex gracilis]
MTEYNNYFEKALEFIGAHQDLIDCHLVDFITERLWNKCLPDKLKLELENVNTMSDDVWTENNNVNSELNSFIQLTRSLSLESCPAVVCADDLPNWFLDKEQVNTFVRPKSEFMKTKKSHEIEVLGKVAAEMALSTRSLVIDAGAGKAYLSTYLSEHFDVPVLAIDSSQVCYKGAINRQEKIQKRKQSRLSKVRYVVQELNDTTDYAKMVNTCYPDWRLNRNLILTGLHTCGNLVHSVIKAFLRAEDIHLLFVVPCCYHLADESLSGRCNFSKNARMLAQQSLERSKHKHLPSSLFYRAVLQVVLQSMGYYNAKVGRGGPLDNFVDYAKWALSKIGIDNKQVR